MSSQSQSASAVLGNPLIVVASDAPFQWQPTDQSGRKYDTKFNLRIIPEKVMDELRAKNTSQKMENGVMFKEVDAAGYADDQLDYAVEGWTDMVAVKHVDGQWVREELPCTRDAKLRLPESVKVDIHRMCSRKEAGAVIAAGINDSPKGSASF